MDHRPYPATLDANHTAFRARHSYGSSGIWGFIIKGSLPYIVIEFAALLLFLFVPSFALWLPGLMK